MVEEHEEDRRLTEQCLRDPRVVVGASDAGAHLDMIDTFRYTTHLLGPEVRDNGLLTTEEAVHLLTQVPAGLHGMVDRGVLEAGAFADLVVFDESTVGSGPIVTRPDLPGGCSRPTPTRRESITLSSTGSSSSKPGGSPMLDPDAYFAPDANSDARTGLKRAWAVADSYRSGGAERPVGQARRALNPDFAGPGDPPSHPLRVGRRIRPMDQQVVRLPVVVEDPQHDPEFVARLSLAISRLARLLRQRDSSRLLRRPRR